MPGSVGGSDSSRAASALAAALGPRGAGQLAADLDAFADATVGLGPLQPLGRDPLVSDILVNAADDIWVDRAGALTPAGVRLPDAAAVRELAVRLVTAAGRRLDATQPCADATLRDGTRIHAVLPPVSPGPVLSIRLVRPEPLPLADLLAGGPPELVGLVTGLIRCRAAVFVTGGTGAGKTTILGALIAALGRSERVVAIEDPAELRTGGSHVVRLAARGANVEGAGAVTLRDLVREAVRMRPDRLVVGEVRGPEVLDLLVALTTGHTGSMATLHATSAAQVPARVAALAALAGLDRALSDAVLATGVQAVIHLARDPAGERGIREIGVVRRHRGRTTVRPAVRVVGGVLREGPGGPALARLLRSGPRT